MMYVKMFYSSVHPSVIPQGRVEVEADPWAGG